MSATLSATESQVLAALRSWLQSILPPTVEVVRGQVNRVPEPKAKDFAILTPIMRERLGTNTTVDDGDTRADTASTKITIQMDMHGPHSADNTQIVSHLFFSDQCDFSLSGLSPLFASEPRQVPFANGSQQIEERWSMDLHLQLDATTTLTQ